MLSNEEKQKTKAAFKAALKDFCRDLQHYVSSEDGQWSVKGFLDVFKNVYTISADTKIVSKVLEVHLFPKILAFAEENNLKVVLAEKQNWYPDFSLVGKDNPGIKFAVDLKTTYRTPDYPGHVNGFTLGSHGNYFVNREKKKNIQFPYSQYLGHFCLGAIYTRTVSEDLTGMDVYAVKELGSLPEAAHLSSKKDKAAVAVQDESHETKTVFKMEVKQVEELKNILSVVKDFQFFACEKWELASDSEGSHNTANIGGINCLEDVLLGNGMFARLGEDVFDGYWTNFGKAVIQKEGKLEKITNLEDYLIFRGMDVNLINKKPPRRKIKKAKPVRKDKNLA